MHSGAATSGWRWLATAGTLVLGVWILLASASSVAEPQEDPRSAWLETAYAEEDAVVIPLAISDLSQVVAIDLALVYDAASFPGVSVRGTSRLSGFLVMSNTVADTLKVAIAGFSPASGSGAFIEIVVPGAHVPELGILKLLLNASNGDVIPVDFAHWLDADTSTQISSAPSGELVPGWAPLSSYPNPFNAATTIAFGLPGALTVRLAIYDLLGRTVRVLVDGTCAGGPQRVVWDGRDARGEAVASGLYLAVLDTGGAQQRLRLLVIR